jgi:hypothetical protein
MITLQYTLQDQEICCRSVWYDSDTRSTYTCLFHFQKLSASTSSAPFNSFLIFTNNAHISLSLARPSFKFFALAPAFAAVAPRCKWNMSFLDSWVILRDVMIKRSRRSFCSQGISIMTVVIRSIRSDGSRTYASSSARYDSNVLFS